MKYNNAKYLVVEAGVRYWEDATVNGKEDIDGDLIPFRKGDLWCPKIDVQNGRIVNWPANTVADIHYKVCDAGSYYLFDKGDNLIVSIENEYVPKILSPGGSGFGDYIIMTVRENGSIDDWVIDYDGWECD